MPLLYDELRRLASQQLSNEKPGQSLNATALVHDAYFKLLGDQKFESRRHFLVLPLKPCDEFWLIALGQDKVSRRAEDALASILKAGWRSRPNALKNCSKSMP